MATPPDIQDLADSPAEALHVELKEWIDISDPVARAKTARHLAALANHGGGYFIIGFRDDGTAAVEHTGDLTSFTYDQFSGIIDRYLDPAFQCDVFRVRATTGGSECIVVRVPGHGSIPICTKANGPHDDRGRPQGIRQGEHYIRVPGPKSVAIETPEHWRALINRCVLNDRQALLERFGRVLRPTEEAPRPAGVSLKEWHDAMRAEFEDRL